MYSKKISFRAQHLDLDTHSTALNAGIPHPVFDQFRQTVIPPLTGADEPDPQNWAESIDAVRRVAEKRV